jgi:GAF domain-containing protein
VGSGQVSAEWTAWWDQACVIVSDWEAVNQQLLGTNQASALAQLIAQALFAEHGRGGEEDRQLLSGLSEICLLIGAAQDATALERVVTRRAMDLLKADGAELFVPDENGRRLRSTLIAGYGRVDRPHATWVGFGEGATGRAYVSGQAVVVQDYATWEGAVSKAVAYVGAHMAVPVLAGGRVRGCLGVSYREPYRCTTERLHALTLLASLTAPLLNATASPTADGVLIAIVDQHRGQPYRWELRPVQYPDARLLLTDERVLDPGGAARLPVDVLWLELQVTDWPSDSQLPSAAPLANVQVRHDQVFACSCGGPPCPHVALYDWARAHGWQPPHSSTQERLARLRDRTMHTLNRLLRLTD